VGGQLVQKTRKDILPSRGSKLYRSFSEGTARKGGEKNLLTKSSSPLTVGEHCRKEQ